MSENSSYRIIQNNEVATVYTDGNPLGTIAFSINPCHSEHTYLKLDLKDYETSKAKGLFSALKQKENKPFQVMIDEQEENVISFLCAAGFLCKRKCYEIEASLCEYIGSYTTVKVPFASNDSTIYRECCELMLERYITTHKSISPWTGSKQQFFENLPNQVYYKMENQQIMHFAFVEDNEIAYVYGTSGNGFLNFAECLVNDLFLRYDTVCFEADDCDVFAMQLKSLFDLKYCTSYDTYVL